MECNHNFKTTERHEGFITRFGFKQNRYIVYINMCTNCGLVKHNWVEIPIKLIGDKR